MKNDYSAIKFNDELESNLWKNNEILSEVRLKLLEIAKKFKEYLNIDVDLEDIVMTGSLANYNYNKYSDIDLHLIIDFADIDDNVDLVKEFLVAKKNLWNNNHDITIHGYEVEIYPEQSGEIHSSSGIYSIITNEWIREPSKFDNQPDLKKVKKKVKMLSALIDDALKSVDWEYVDRVKAKVRSLRKASLATQGELGDTNIAYKVLRNSGKISKLMQRTDDIMDDELSL